MNKCYFYGKEEVLTIHGSQGREWDIVILSVVDTTNKWFTNSKCTKSNGLKVINTAVSRAKKKLVIVCDANYWKTQQEQLIGKLISIGKEIQNKLKNSPYCWNSTRKIERVSAFLLVGTRADTTLQEMIILWQKPRRFLNVFAYSNSKNKSDRN